MTPPDIALSPSPQPEYTSWALRGRWLVAVTVFTVLPYLLISFYLGRSWQQQLDEKVEKVSLRMEVTLMKLTERSTDTCRFLGHLLYGAWFPITSLPKRERPAAFAEMFSRVNRHFPGMFRFLALDRHGQVISADPSFFDLATLPQWQHLASIIQGSRSDIKKRDHLYRENAELIRHFYGPETKPWFISVSDAYWIGHARPGERFGVFFAGYDPTGCLFALIDEPRGFEHLGIRHHLARLAPFFARRGMNVGQATRQPVGGFDPSLQAAINALGQSPSLCARFGNEVVAVTTTAKQGTLWIRYSLDKHLAGIDRNRRWLALGALLIGGWGLLLFRIMRHPERWYPSLRFRLIALFLFACGFPLLAVWLAGSDYVYEKRLILRNQAWEDLSSRLVHFDQGLREDNRLIARKIREEARDFGSLSRKELGQRLEALRREHPKAGFFISDQEGNLVITKSKEVNDQQELMNPSELSLLGSIGKKLLAELNGTQLTGIDTAGLVLDSVGKETEAVGNFLRSLGEFMDWDLGGNRNFLLFLPLRAKEDAEYSRFLTVHTKDFDRFREYVEQRLFQHSRHVPQTNFSASHPEFSGMFPAPLSPRWNRFLEAHRRIKALVKFRDRTVRARLLGRDEILLCGIRSPTFSRAVYIAIHRGSSVHKTIRELEANLRLLMFLSAALSLFLGFHLSERFLTPLTQLKDGVNAIRQGDFGFRLPPGNPDEFGLLAQSFNSAMENLADLDLGRILQERLFPDGLHSTGEYRIAGKSLFATQLGGDLFDIRPLPDGRTLVLIGDVTGHGLGAALVMAMARGLVCRLASEDLSPAEMLRSIHQVLFKTMKRRRMMTCLIGLLDPHGHRLVLANAGQCSPIRVKPGRNAELLTTSSKPLGSWKTIEPASLTLEIEPGESIFLYTDGAVEAVTRDGNQIGYGRLASRIQELREGDPPQSLERLYGWLEQVAGKELKADDVTCILIRRRLHDREKKT